MTFPHRRCPLTLGVIVALTLRFALFIAGPSVDHERAVLPDSPRMLLLAENLRKYGTYGKENESGLVHLAIAAVREENGTLPPPDGNGLRPEVFRPPGYPALLCVIETMAGNWFWMLPLQCVLGGVCGLLLAQIVRDAGLPPRAAYLALYVWAIHPGLIIADCLCLTESMYNSVATIGMYLTLRQSRKVNLAGALLIGCSSLIRPLGVLLIPLAILLSLRAGRRWFVLALVATILFPSLLWSARNKQVGEGYRPTTAGDVNLLYYTAAYTISEARGEDWMTSWPDRIRELTERLSREVRPGEDVVPAMRRIAFAVIREHPQAFLKVQLKSQAKLAVDHSVPSMYLLLGWEYHPTGLGSWLLSGQKPEGVTDHFGAVLSLLWLVFNLLLAATALIGAFRIWRSGRRWFAVILILTLILFAAATGSVGIERMRLPMMMPLCLLTAVVLCKSTDTQTLPHPSSDH